jgi:hypothetical protein
MKRGIQMTNQIRSREGGYVTAAVLVLLVISVVSGAFMLKSSKNRAATSSNYFQARSAAYAAHSGLEAGLADLEKSPSASIELLNNYLADNSKAWLLGGTSNASSATWMNLGTNKQQFATSIVAYDFVNGLIKLASNGRGPGGSESVAYGVFQMGGVQPEPTVLAKYAWYMAGEARNVDKTIDVDGEVYFGGDVHFNGGADNSIFRGTVKIAKGSGNQSSFDSRVTFTQNTLIQTPFKTQGNGIIFQKNVGFEGNINADTDIRLNQTGQKAYFKSNITAGNAKINLGFNQLIDNGALNLAKAYNFGPVQHQYGTFSIADSLGLKANTELEVTVDMSAIPSNKRLTLQSLGYGTNAITNGPDLSAAYQAAKASGKLYQNFLVLNVSQSYVFTNVANNVLKGKFVFDVSTTQPINGIFPICDPTTVCLIRVANGGNLQGFGSEGLFRGYINVSGNGWAIYQWGPAGEFHGALHHVSPTTGFQLNSSPSPMKLVFEQAVFDELIPLKVLCKPGESTPALPNPKVQLVDTKIRPRYISRYF